MKKVYRPGPAYKNDYDDDKMVGGNPNACQDSMGNDIETGSNYTFNRYEDGALYIYIGQALSDTIGNGGTMELRLRRIGKSVNHKPIEMITELEEQVIDVFPETLVPGSLNCCMWGKR